jgi:predicted phage tail protein
MGKGGGSASTPTVIPDNLKNKQILRTVDLITEGQIEGPVGGLRGILINNTPVEATDGTVNIKGVSVEWKAGTQSQEPLVGFDDIENEVSVGVEVKFNEPVTRTVSDVDVDRVRFTIGVNQLVYTDDQGNQGRTSVSLSLQFFENGTWTTKKVVDIDGKTSTTYLESHIIDAPSVKPFQIRVIRNTPDSTNERLINTTIWSSYTELTNASLSYPNSAVVGIAIDRSQFSGTPSRTYHIRGKIIKVPDNYDPVTRTYNGIWTGNFKLAYTNNPAWVFYDLVINDRYGLGKRLGSFNVNKFTMYAIGQYCDVKVPDGLGGEEPRFTCNAIIAEQRKAIDTLSDMASVFRAMPVWDGLQLTCVQDRPTDKEWTYTNASVIDGKFIRSSSALKARHTAIEVSWINPDNGWKSEIEYVADDELIKRFGYNVNKVAAFGCTSRGQANRVGRWILETEKLETKTIKFSVAMEGLNSQPGDMIEVADNDYAIAKVGGRVVSFSGNSITLDAPVEILAGESASFSYLSASGKFDKIAISGHPSPDVITLSSVPNGLKQWGVFSISKASLSTQLYRVSTIAGPDNGIYSIIAVQHEPQKEAIVDRGANFEGVPSTLASVRVPNIEKLRIGSIPDSTLAQAKAIWETVTINRGITFDVRVLRDGREVSSGNTAEFEYYFNGLDAGAYEVAVRGRDERGMLGEESAVDMIIGAPAAPSRVDIIEGFLQLTLTPHITAPQTFATQFEFWFSGENKIPNINDIETTAIRLGRGTFWVKDALKAGHKYYFYIRSVNEWGKSAFIEAAGTPSIDAGGILDTILDNFNQTSAGKELFGKIEINTDAIIENSISNDADAVSKWAQYGENRAGIVEVRKVQLDSERAFAEYQQLVTVRFNGVDASISDVRTAQATTDSALAEFKIQTGVKFNQQDAVIQTKATTVFDSSGGSAIYSVKAGVNYNGNYYDAGMVIGVEASGNTIKSQVGFNADTFIITSGQYGAKYSPFAITNGQVFINEAFIRDGTITNAKIGGYIQSFDYNPGVSGWIINRGGNAEFNNSYFRGEITMDTTTGGIRTVINSSSYTVYHANGAVAVKLGYF